MKTNELIFLLKTKMQSKIPDVWESVKQADLSKISNEVDTKRTIPVYRIVTIAVAVALVFTVGYFALNNFGSTQPDNKGAINQTQQSGTSAKPTISKQPTISNTFLQTPTMTDSQLQTPTPTPTPTDSYFAGVFIPEFEIPVNDDAGYSPYGYLVFQNRIYSNFIGTKISKESAGLLLDTKLGITILSRDKTVEFASSSGSGLDVYSLKGYNSEFRLMAVRQSNGIILGAELFDHNNGYLVKSGADVFNQLMIQDNIKAVKYESSDSWNWSKQQYHDLSDIQLVYSFIDELNKTTPYAIDNPQSIYTDEYVKNMKMLYIKLQDGSEVSLHIYGDAFIGYGGVSLRFKMNNPIFDTLWNMMVIDDPG